MTIPPDIQCQRCFGDGRPVKVKKKNEVVFFSSNLFILFSLIQSV